MAAPPLGAGVVAIPANLALPIGPTGPTGPTELIGPDNLGITTKSISEFLHVLNLQNNSFELPSMITPHEIYEQYIKSSSSFQRYLNVIDSDSKTKTSKNETSKNETSTSETLKSEISTSGKFNLQTPIQELTSGEKDSIRTKIQNKEGLNTTLKTILSNIKKLWEGDKKQQDLNGKANAAAIKYWNDNISGEFDTTKFANSILEEVNK